VSLHIASPGARHEQGIGTTDLDHVPSSTLRYALQYGGKGYGVPGDGHADDIDDH
jgi:hypothetical protein